MYQGFLNTIIQVMIESEVIQLQFLDLEINQTPQILIKLKRKIKLVKLKIKLELKISILSLIFPTKIFKILLMVRILKKMKKHSENFKLVLI